MGQNRKQTLWQEEEVRESREED